MGVPGLWAILRDAGIPRSLTDIAVTDGFNNHDANNPVRAFRVGIDASIWFVHAEYGKEGENPELRTIFFRLTKLLQVPFLPVFVFDGPLRPELKRGKLIDTKPNWMIEGLKTMIDAFGFEWRTAPGEAEAELAYLNTIGVVDAVLTDDVDTLVFGAKLVIRNQSKNLSGNKAHDLTNADGRDDKNHTMTFSMADLERNPKVNLNQAGLILIALLSGGDYSKGVEGCGPTVAAGLAHSGFGDSLVTKIRSLSLSITLGLQTNGTSGSRKASKTRVTLGACETAELKTWLGSWREELCRELRTNSQGCLGKKSPALAARIEQTRWTPDVQVLMAYVNPVTSEERAVAKALVQLFRRRSREETPSAEVDRVVANAKREIAEELRRKIVWAADPDIAAIARVCEDRFEWGVKDIIIKRFRSWLWAGVVCRMLRRGAIVNDENDARRSVSAADEPPGSQRTVAAKQLENLVLSSPRKGASRRPLRPAGDSSDEEGKERNSVILKIHSSRTHASTDGLLEYRLEIDPSSFVKAVEAGIEGKREIPKTGWTDDDEDEDEDDEGLKKKVKKSAVAQPNDPLRVWMPACMVREVVPELVQTFEDKSAKKATRAKSKPKGAAAGKKAGAANKFASSQMSLLSEGASDSDPVVPVPVSSPKKAFAGPSRIATLPLFQSDEDEDADKISEPAVRPSLRSILAKPAAMPDFFKTRKSTTIKATKPNKSVAPTLDRNTSSTKSSAMSDTTARVASLFSDPDVQLFRDLTKRSAMSSQPAVRTQKPTLRRQSRPAANTLASLAGDYIEISSDSDVPKLPPLPKVVVAAATRPTLRQPDTSVIDLCSDSD